MSSNRNAHSLRALSFTRLLALALCALAVLHPRSARGDGLRIHVRGSAKLSAQVSRDQGELVLSGSLVDDAGEPLSSKMVTVQITRESDPLDAKVAEGMRTARTCDMSANRMANGHVLAKAHAGEVSLQTDDSGRFCLRAKLPADRHLAQITWPASGLVDSAATSIRFDTSREALSLRFDPTPRIVWLDAPTLRVEVLALVEDDGALRVKQGLVVVLSNEAALELGRSTTDAIGHASFSVNTQKIGPPGRGALRVAFEGNRDTSFAEAVADVERHAKVALRVPAAAKGQLAPGVADEGIPLDVDVSCAAGAVGEGTVEATVGDVTVGAAPVERGRARLTVTFSPSPDAKSAPVRLRYVPMSPWFEPLAEAQVDVPLRPPSAFSRAPIFVACAVVVGWFMFARRRAQTHAAPQPATERREGVPEAPGHEPGVALIRVAAAGDNRLHGRVVDAHDAVAVPFARVRLTRGDFSGMQVLASVTADADGRFELTCPAPTTAGGNQVQLVVEGRLHTPLTQSVPPPGEIAVALVLRQRALLARLVAWARRHGRPFDAKPEPTPGHVRRAAGHDAQTARWALELERAVFGREDVDADVERAIDALAPSPGPGRPISPPMSPPESPANPIQDDHR